MNIENIRINRTGSYGRYIVTGTVNGIEVSAPTTDSEAFDYLNDDDFPEKQQDALDHCKMVLEIAFEGL